MAKQKLVICDFCGSVVGDRNFGTIDKAGNVRDFCKAECRAKGRTLPPVSDLPKTKATIAAAPKRLSKAAIKKALRPKETDISKTIGDDLERTTKYSSRLQSGAVLVASGKTGKPYRINLCTTGTPDRICADSLVIFFEIKKPDETPSEEQKRVINDLRANGALVFVVDNYDDYKFIRLQINKRRERLKRIAAEIRQIQSEIDSELKNKMENK